MHALVFFNPDGHARARKVSLLLVCVNHLKSGRSRMVEESDERSQEALAASAARRRTGSLDPPISFRSERGLCKLH